MINITISNNVQKRIEWLTNNYSLEISGWLTGTIKKEGIYIENILFPEQIVTSASVDTNGKQLINLRKEYGKECLKIIGHWHSHHTMNNLWSATDEEFIKNFMHEQKEFLFIVTSRRDGHRVRLELREPYDLSIDNLSHYIEEDNNELAIELEHMIKEKVKEKTVTVIINKNVQGRINKSYGGYGYYDNNTSYYDNKELEPDNTYDTKKGILRIFDLERTETDRLMAYYPSYEYTLGETKSGRPVLCVQCERKEGGDMIDYIKTQREEEVYAKEIINGEIDLQEEIIEDNERPRG